MKSVVLSSLIGVRVKYVVLFSLFAMNLVEQPAPEVTIAQGVVSGKISADGEVLEYIGIPFATVEKRFQAPGPPPKWSGVLKATDDIYMCPQSTAYGVLGTEDCLRINVYVPAHASRPLSVMVWVHGGAFKVGSGGKLLYGPNFIVKKNVILVTFNYRLGALGFTCLGIKEAPGNAGLKDQVAALRWVKDNIAAFGGNPDHVTVFGESAGGTSTSLLLASEVTKGLFNKAIIQSGSSIASWAINRKPVWVASLLAKELGYDTEDPIELHKIFSEMSYKELTSLTATKPEDIFFETKLLYLPCVEENIPGVEAFLTDLPYNVITKNPKDIPMLFGSTSNEGLFLLAEETTDESMEERNGKYLFASDLAFLSKDEAEAASNRVKEFYFEDKRIGRETIFNVSDLYTHMFFEMPIILEAEHYKEQIKSPIYNYIFDYSGERNFMKKYSGFPDQPGACHGDDLPYLFDGIILPFKVKSEDAKIIDYMTTMWTNFAKYGNPTPENLPVRWEASTKDNLTFLYIDRELKTGPMPNPRAYQLWRDMYRAYRNTDR